MKNISSSTLKRIISAALLLALVAVLGACASSTKRAWDLEPKKKEALLRERVLEMWTAQIAGDRETMFEYYDTFFRARVYKGFFAGKRSAIVYSKTPTIVLTEIKGNVARVRVSVVFEVKGLMGKFGPIDRDPEHKLTDETWLFMDRTWYRQYIDYISNSSIAKY